MAARSDRVNHRFALPESAPVADRVAVVAVVGVVACGALLAVAAPRTSSLLPESIRPAPAALAGAFGPIALDLHVLGAIAVLSAMFGLYTIAVRHSGGLTARLVVGAILALHLLVLLAPPLLSTDVFSYQAYARMGARYGFNPYLSGPHAIDMDPVFQYVGAKWSYTPSAYGPVFTVFSYLFAPLSIAVSVIAYKMIAAAASLALVAVLWRCAVLRGLDPVRTAALVGLNPLLVVYGVGGGHNDLLMLLAMSAGLLATLSARDQRAGALGMLAVSIKLTAGVVLPFALLAARRSGNRDAPSRGRAGLLVGVLAGLLISATLSVAVFGTGTLHLLSTVVQSQSEGDWKSIPGAITDRLHLPAVGRVTTWLLAALFLVVAAGLLQRVRHGLLDWIDGAGWTMLALLVASSSMLPWYVAWLLPFAGLARDPRLRTTTVAMTGVVLGIQMLGYIPHGVSLL